VFAPSRIGRGFLAVFCAAAYLAVFQPASASEKNKAALTFRWAEGTPGCTFSRDSDGKYRYGLWTPEFGVTLSVDAQELMLVHKRAERFFGVQVTLRYRGNSNLEFDPGHATLEFVKHSKVVQPSLDPESFVQRIQADLDQLEHDTQREVERHPEKKEEREKYVQAYQHDATELMDFVTRHTLSPVQLDSGNSETSGWILFSTKNKWIGDWKRPEEFVLRLPIGGNVVEFPFLLPPKKGDLILRQRPN
jgi:hypothetical protein